MAILSGVGMCNCKPKVSKAKYSALFNPSLVFYQNLYHYSTVIVYARRLKYSWSPLPCNIRFEILNDKMRLAIRLNYIVKGIS